MIDYMTSTDRLALEQLGGFFVGWPNPPDPATHLRLLQQSAHVVLAIDSETQRVVGFITAVTDGVLSAYIPLLEVLPAYQHRGIGGELVERMLDRLRDIYMVDLLCDQELQRFYSEFGMQPCHGMMLRNYTHQCGVAPAEPDKSSCQD